jgi:hypothetical protein
MNLGAQVLWHHGMINQLEPEAWQNVAAQKKK